MKLQRFLLNIVFEEFFQFSLITYLILILLESFRQGFVSFFFNINILLFLVLASGVVMVLTRTEHIQISTTKKINLSSDLQNGLIFAVIGGLIVFLKTENLGQVSIITSIFTMLIILLLSYLFLTDKHRSRQNILTDDKASNLKDSNLININLNSAPQNHVIDYGEKSQMKALSELKIANYTFETLKKRFKNTSVEPIFIEKILPFDKLIRDSLQILSGHIEDAERQKLEKLVEIYKQNLHTRLMQLESAL